MPGEPTGIPGTASPAIAGRSLSSRSMSATGTWPTMVYPPTRAVWHAARGAGTPNCRLMDSTSFTACTVTLNPLSRRYDAHWAQHEQLGDLYTTISGPV